MWSLQKGLKATFKNICMSECVSVCGGELWGGGFSGFFFLLQDCKVAGIIQSRFNEKKLRVYLMYIKGVLLLRAV